MSLELYRIDNGSILYEWDEGSWQLEDLDEDHQLVPTGTGFFYLVEKFLNFWEVKALAPTPADESVNSAGYYYYVEGAEYYIRVQEYLALPSLDQLGKPIAGSDDSDDEVDDNSQHQETEDDDDHYYSGGDDDADGGGGDDRLYGLAGYDKLKGGDGDDYLSGGNDDDDLSGDDGDDDLHGGDGDDSVKGGSGDDYINGGSGDDDLSGDDGDDTIAGGDGNDKVNGGIGDDTMIGGSALGSDQYIGGAGIDSVTYHSALAGVFVNLQTGKACSRDDKEDAGIGSDKLASVENVEGSQFDDLLIGSSGANAIDGRGGDDDLDGLQGVDAYTGGNGLDTFWFSKATDTGLGVKSDTITDFVRGQDKIDLTKIDARKGFTKNDAFVWSDTAPVGVGTQRNGVLWFEAGVLYGSTDRDSAAEFAIRLTGVDALSATDIVL